MATILIHLNWKKLEETPTLLVADNYYYPMHNIPFPSITLCNVNKVYAPATGDIRNKLYGVGMLFSNRLMDFQ